jgi:hypothetical protein
MRAIKVTYRAIFRQPIGLLNPMKISIPGVFPVEIFGGGERWQAREIASTRRTVYAKLHHFTSPIQGMMEVDQAFKERLEPWQIWGTPPGETQERLMLAGEVCDLGHGKMAWYEDEDRTHIIHAQTIPPGARIPPAACGAKVNAKCFISTKANVEPSCKGCAEVWKREYQGK